MKNLKLYNTLTNKQQHFKPRQEGRVKLFTCGPSVYRKQHLGNYRTYLYEDVLQKYLQYLGYDVHRVINFTDVEDKAIDEARQKKISLEALRRPVEEAFFKECELLNIKLPNDIPRASTSVESAVDLIKRLLDRGHAYWYEDEVYFDPTTYNGFGRIYGLDMSQWPDKKVRFHQDTYPGHRWNLGDFILWHKREPEDGDVWWETELGQGRPAWNIQDAAMISKNLGFEIDIHTGGFDNLYRHHDYTLAIMEGASGRQFCPWWLHGGELFVDGEKMSKSKGNVTYVGNLLEQGFQPSHIRFFLLYGPYRDELDMCLPCVEERAGHLDRVKRLVDALSQENHSSATAEKDWAQELRSAFELRMNDNLDYAGAFDAVADVLQQAVHVLHSDGLSKQTREPLLAALNDVDAVLGVLL